MGQVVKLEEMFNTFCWRNFQKVINRAMIACETSGHRVTDDFPEVRKIVEAAKAFLL